MNCYSYVYSFIKNANYQLFDNFEKVYIKNDMTHKLEINDSRCYKLLRKLGLLI